MGSKSTVTKCLIEPIPPPRSYHQYLPGNGSSDSYSHKKLHFDTIEVPKSGIFSAMDKDWASMSGPANAKKPKNISTIRVSTPRSDHDSLSVTESSLSRVLAEITDYGITDETKKVPRTNIWKARNGDPTLFPSRAAPRALTTWGGWQDGIQDIFSRFFSGSKRR